MQRHLRTFVLTLAGVLLLATEPAEAQMDARDLEMCRMDCRLRTRGDDDPRFRTCMARNCGDRRATTRQQTTPRRQAAAPAAPQPAIGTWRFDNHEAVGPSAHVQLEQGVIALACAPEGGDRITLRASNGLFRAPFLSYVSDTAASAATIAAAPGAAASEISGSACEVGLAGLMTAGTITLVDASIAGRTALPAGGQSLSFEVGGTTLRIGSGAEALERLGGRSVPMTGSSAAISQMLNACPAARAALGQPCPP